MTNPPVDPNPDRPPPAAPPPATGPQAPASPTPEQKKITRAVSAGQILAGILFVLVVIFIAENSSDVAVRIIAGPKVTAPVSVWLLIAAVVGALVAALMRARRKHTAKLKARARNAPR